MRKAATAASILLIGGGASCSLFTDFGGFSNPVLVTEAGTINEAGVVKDPDAALDGAISSLDGTDGTIAPNTYPAVVLADGPLAYQRFEETTGTFASDSTDHHNDATVTGEYTWGENGIAGKGLTLTGADVNYGDRFDFQGTSPFTLEAWAFATKIDGDYRHIFTKNYEPSGQGREAYGLYFHATNVTFERYVKGNGIYVEQGFVSRLNTWAHIVAVYDGTTASLYVDGVFASKQDDARASGAKPTSFHAATRDSDGGRFIGVLDELAVYDKALTATQIKAHFDAAPPH